MSFWNPNESSRRKMTQWRDAFMTSCGLTGSPTRRSLGVQRGMVAFLVGDGRWNAGHPVPVIANRPPFMFNGCSKARAMGLTGCRVTAIGINDSVLVPKPNGLRCVHDD